MEINYNQHDDGFSYYKSSWYMMTVKNFFTYHKLEIIMLYNACMCYTTKIYLNLKLKVMGEPLRSSFFHSLSNMVKSKWFMTLSYFRTGIVG